MVRVRVGGADTVLWLGGYAMLQYLPIYRNKFQTISYYNLSVAALVVIVERISDTQAISMMWMWVKTRVRARVRVRLVSDCLFLK